MADSVYKVVELVGTSETSISKAIDGAISKAGETVRHLGWFEVTQIRGRIDKGKIENYQVTLKAGFKLEDYGKSAPVMPGSALPGACS